MPPVNLRVLGPVRLTQDGRTLASWSGKPGRILRALAVGGPTLAGDLCGVLWPDDDVDCPLEDLQSHVSKINARARETGGGRLVVGTTEGYTLADEVLTDVAAYRRLIKEAIRLRQSAPFEARERYDEALSLLAVGAEERHVALIPGWQMLRAGAAAAFEWLTQQAAAQGEQEGALEYALRALAFDPTWEAMGRFAIERCQELERLGEARRIYRSLDSAVRLAFDADLEPATQSLGVLLFPGPKPRPGPPRR